ncbi:ABC transporter ATP-binding protein [Halobacteriales archaeon QH_3_68_24]|jgi:branched-chain amino acid transport system ATP-binding protein|nr:MAG: ABC transporter ATP-binding protein [Halobacteriales archaeon QH_3_68_24]
MLELAGVRSGYGDTPILHDIDLAVDHGEVVGVMGKNGVGKSTLVKTVVGLLSATAGQITIDGTDVTDRDADDRARMGVGYIPQGREVFPKLTVEENLRMGETINADSDDLLYDEVYDYFSILEERASQQGGTLSGGQQQMLAIGRALVGNPDLLVLDEPSEGIQPSIVDQITEDIRAINRDLGTTVLFVEQNLGVVQEMADRCYAMERGRIVDELDEAALADEENIASFLAV